MNFATNEGQREVVTFEGYDYEIHDIAFNGEVFPRFPFVVYAPFIAFSSGQLQSYLNRYFAMLRVCEMVNIYLYNPITNIPFSIFCGICGEPHIIDRPMTASMFLHFSTGRVRIPQWNPLFARPPTEENYTQQN